MLLLLCAHVSVKFGRLSHFLHLWAACPTCDWQQLGQKGGCSQSSGFTTILRYGPKCDFLSVAEIKWREQSSFTLLGKWSNGNYSAGEGCAVHARKLDDEVGSSVRDKEQMVNSQFEVHKNNINL